MAKLGKRQARIGAKMVHRFEFDKLEGRMREARKSKYQAKNIYLADE